MHLSFPGEDHIPCAFGYAVVFPDCDYSGPMPPGGETAIVFSAKDLPYLNRRIPEALKKWSPQKKTRPLSEKDLDGVLKGLSPSFQLLPVLFRRIEEQEERLFRLTNEQARLLSYLRNQKRAVIEGVAGSGKTMLAKAQAQYYAEKGMKTLVACYNKALSEWLAASMPESYADTVTVAHFHQLCKSCCDMAKMKFTVPSENINDFWRYQAPELMIEALQQCDLRFDAIVVDEGQDFFPEWWIALEEIQREKDGPFFLFYDPAQNLFVGEDFLIPGLGKAYPLDTNCRNTQEIAKTCSLIRGIDIPVRPDCPIGDKVQVHLAETQKKQTNYCKDIINSWIGSGKLKPSQIAIQSPHTRSKSSLAAIPQLGHIPLVDKLADWQADNGILFSTIRSFKGLEADAVILIDVPLPDTVPHFTQADFYVATSRAKHLLSVLTTAEGII